MLKLVGQFNVGGICPRSRGEDEQKQKYNNTCCAAKYVGFAQCKVAAERTLLYKYPTGMRAAEYLCSSGNTIVREALLMRGDC